MKSENSELVNIRMTNAKETLNEVMNVLIENNLWNTSVNRLYYACFYAVTALLISNEIETKTHSGTKQMFGLHFIKSGIISEELGDFYSTLFRMRQKADYEDLVEYEKEDVHKLIQPATDLISAIEDVLIKQ